jgi:hypothetical protein
MNAFRSCGERRTPITIHIKLVFFCLEYGQKEFVEVHCEVIFEVGWREDVGLGECQRFWFGGFGFYGQVLDGG